MLAFLFFIEEHWGGNPHGSTHSHTPRSQCQVKRIRAPCGTRAADGRGGKKVLRRHRRGGCGILRQRCPTGAVRLARNGHLRDLVVGSEGREHFVEHLLRTAATDERRGPPSLGAKSCRLRRLCRSPWPPEAACWSAGASSPWTR